VLWDKHYPRGTSFPDKGIDGFVSHKRSRGAQGCMLSWLEMLRTISSGTDEIVTVFEDDIYFHPDWNKEALEYYNDTPSDFDLVYMGSQGFYPSILNDRILRVPTVCMHALLFTKAGATRIYDYLVSQKEQFAIDVMLLENTRDFTPYVWNNKYISTRNFNASTGLVFQDLMDFKSVIASTQ
jgi:GR25 family glycosyltransferase involved in LPS biosynthesis